MIDLVLADTLEALPAHCRAALVLEAAGEATLVRDDHEPIRGIRLDGLGAPLADRLARVMAPRADAGSDGRAGLPPSIGLLDLLGDGALDPAAVRRRWSSGAPPTALLGVTTDGPWRVDLAADGPHLLVGGTTGSGKSELLQSLVLSLAHSASPDEITFVLVDYKGGSAFGACAALPHVVGLVTDLDDHLTERALVALRAELRRRERAFAEVGARDLDEYRRRRGAGEPLARLVLVVDEFRHLATEFPEFLGGLVHLADVGRSLGVHLVLATQRPAGIVSAEIQANVNLRIALRDRDASDSQDVVESPAAAALSADTPGRGFARVGGGDLLAVQVAWAGGCSIPTEVERPVTVTPVPAEPSAVFSDAAAASDAATGRGARITSPASPAGGEHTASGPTDLEQLVGTLVAAAEGQPSPRRPWPEPLPREVSAASLDPMGEGAVIGLLDLPDEQRRAPLTWAPDAGHWLLIGGGRSGRSTALRTIARVAAAQWRPSRLHIHGIDAAAGLASVSDLPHLGTLLGAEHLEAVPRLLARLAEELTARAAALAATGLDSLAQWHQRHAEGEAPPPPPALLLLIDGWEQVTAEFGGPGPALIELLRQGPTLGLTAVITGGPRAALPLAGLAAQTWLLSLDDPTDGASLRVPVRDVPRRDQPGRMVRTRDGRQAHLAIAPAGHPVLHDAPDAAVPTARPLRLRALPNRLDPAALLTSPTAIGVSGDEAQPLLWDSALTAPRALIAGAGGSGRSTTLAALGWAARASGVDVLAVPGRDHRLADLLVGSGARVVEASALVPGDRPTAVSRGLVLVDDVEGLVDSAAEELLCGWAAAQAGDVTLVGACAPEAALSAVRGLMSLLRRDQQGFLLSPHGLLDGQLFAVTASRDARLPRGRALLCRGRVGRPVQLVHREAPSAAGAPLPHLVGPR